MSQPHMTSELTHAHIHAERNNNLPVPMLAIVARFSCSSSNHLAGMAGQPYVDDIRRREQRRRECGSWTLLRPPSCVVLLLWQAKL